MNHEPIYLKQKHDKFRSDMECDTGSNIVFLVLIQNGLGVKPEFKYLERS